MTTVNEVREHFEHFRTMISQSVYADQNRMQDEQVMGRVQELKYLIVPI